MKYELFSKKQLTAMLWWLKKDTENYKAIICDGSVRSGKTLSMTIGFVLWSMKNFDGESFAFCGKTIDSLKRNVITPMEKWLAGIVKAKINSSRNYLDISLNGKKNRYYIFGGKDAGSYKLIQGITLAGALLDEVALMPRSFVEQAVMRCSVGGSKLWFNCNPEGSEHWFYKEWVLQSENKNALHLHFTMEDNLSLAEETKIMYENSFSGVFYDRYIRGLWVLAEGLVYSMFDKSRHVLEDDYEPANAMFYISCDYGILNPTSMGLWALENGRAVRIKEDYYDGRKNQPRTDEEHYAALEKLARGYNIQFVIVDPSASSFIECIKRHHKFRIRKADNNVIGGINNVSTLIANNRIFICEGCKDILRELTLYRWDNNAQNDKVIKEYDHACDDMRYFVNTIAKNRLMKDLKLKGSEESD